MISQSEYLLGLLILLAAAFAFVYFAKLLAQMRQTGGRVKTDWVGLPDIPMVLTLGGALAGLSLQGLQHASKAPTVMKPEQIVPGMVFLGVLAGGIAVFLAARQLPLGSLFGLRALTPVRAFSQAILLLWAAVPIVFLFNLITGLLLGEGAKQQDLVKLFTDSAKEGNFAPVIQIVIAGVIVAPICEELIFRGYLYPVAKRFLGPTAGAFITATLFAASHLNLASLPGLLVLAICFIIAYERSGSIFVPICMHALFNGAVLVLLYILAQ